MTLLYALLGITAYTLAGSVPHFVLIKLHENGFSFHELVKHKNDPGLKAVVACNSHSYNSVPYINILAKVRKNR